MPHNVGGAERLIRILLGIVLLAAGYFHYLSGTMAIIAYVVGAVALLTGLIRFCPAWSLFGINTCATKPAQQK